jgi:hypothetical protein
MALVSGSGQDVEALQSLFCRKSVNEQDDDSSMPYWVAPEDSLRFCAGILVSVHQE